MDHGYERVALYLTKHVDKIRTRKTDNFTSLSVGQQLQYFGN